MLVRTPHPRLTESLLGYVLRVSEANGYDTPWHVLRYAGLTQGEMKSAALPVEKLAPILGLSPDALHHIAYVSATEEGVRQFRLLGNFLGRGLRYNPLRLNNPFLCPQCVDENGYIDAFWDLSLAVACPVHRRTAVSHCPSCEKRLTWYRPGLLTCKCGASLRGAPTKDVTEALADLMVILSAKVHDTRIEDNALQAGLPTAPLLSMPLRSLLSKLPDFAALSAGFAAGDPGEPITQAAVAAATFAEWPIGFRRFLRGISDSQKEEHQGIAYCKRFKKFYDRFCKSPSCRADFLWLREEFVRFGLEEYGDAIIDNKLLRGHHCSRRFVTKAELARRLGVSPVTLKNWAQNGTIDLKTISMRTQSRYIADTAAFTTPVKRVPIKGNLAQARVAASFLEVPVRVLERLKAGGHLPAVHMPRQKPGYHLLDLEEFRQQLLSMSPACEVNHVERASLVDLKTVLRNHKFVDHDTKAKFVVAYINGEIKSVARTGSTISHILFRKADVTGFDEYSRAVVRDVVSQRSAARLIGCPVRAIPGLIASGHLVSAPSRGASEVTRVSVEHFARTHVALAVLAKNLATTSRRLVRLADTCATPVLGIYGGRHAGPVPFVDRRYLETLHRVAEGVPRGRRNRPGDRQALNAVLTYLEQLRLSAAPLPRRAGRPMRQAIARACGFERSVFYKNRKVAAAVEQYAATESRGITCR